MKTVDEIIDAVFGGLLSKQVNAHELRATLVEALAQQDGDVWYCESHPEHLMGHDNCGGAGVLESARIPILANDLRLARQETRESAAHRDDLIATALSTIRRQAEEIAESDALRDKMASLLSRTAVALRGPEPPRTRWSWDDLPERAAAAIAAIELVQLAQQGQGEAVAWLHTTKLGSVLAFTEEPPPGLKEMCQPLYTAPQPQQPLTDEQERAEFEAWFTKDGDYEPSNLDRSGAHTGLYMNSDTQQQWKAWQARAAHNIKKGGA